MKTPTAHASDPLEDCDAILSAINTLHSTMEDVLTHTRGKLAEVDRLWDVSCPVPNDPNGPDPSPYAERREGLEYRTDVIKSILLKLDSAYGSVQWAGSTIAMEDIA